MEKSCEHHDCLSFMCIGDIEYVLRHGFVSCVPKIAHQGIAILVADCFLIGLCYIIFFELCSLVNDFQ